MISKSFWLIVKKKGLARVVKTYSKLDWDEIAISMTLTLPDGIFDRPQLSLIAKVPDTAAQTPEIPADVAEDARLAIEAATGLEVRLTIAAPEGE